MSLRILHIVLLLAMSVGPASAQAWILGYDDPEEEGWSISTSSSIQTSADSNYPSADIRLGYYGAVLRAGARLRLNEHVNFTFEPRDLIIYVEDPSVAFSEGTRFTARPDHYTIVNPFEGFASLRRGRGELGAQLSLLMQETQVEVPEPQLSSDGVYLIGWREHTYRQVRLSGAVIGRYHLRRAHFSAGVLALPALRFGDGSFPYAFRPRMSPYVGMTFVAGPTALGAGTTTQEASVSLQRSLPNILASERHDITGRIQYRSALQGFSYGVVDAGLEIPLYTYLTGAVGVTHSWTHRASLSPADFSEWQRTLVPGSGAGLNHSLPHTSIKLGARLHFGRPQQPFPIEVQSIDLVHDKIYSANRGFYAQNPIGFINLRNRSNRVIRTRIAVETSRSGGKYRSNRFVISARGERRIPLFLDPGDVSAAASPEQLTVVAEWGNGAEVLTSVPVVIYGRNAWDGDVASLSTFITPEAPEIRRRAKRLFLDAGSTDSTAARLEVRFARLQEFITALGRGISYVPDPSAARADRVQYPEETLQEAGGDCEDLTVYLASSLMSVGIGAAVVAVSPSALPQEAGTFSGTRREGHVFVLVDTGVRPAQMAVLGLNEFQTATRTDDRGRSTIWIPLETTALDRGFDAAFAEGARQYSLTLFNDSAVAAGDVQVLDF